MASPVPPPLNKIGFPNPQQVISCQHCCGKCAYSGFQQFEWKHVLPDGGGLHFQIGTSYCLTCGKPIIAFGTPNNGQYEIVYPKGSKRPKAPQEVKDGLPDCADDYDEAGACEPHSKQAAALLLGRCASEILVDKCDADKTITLGGQFKAAHQGGKLPPDLADQFAGLVEGRNQSGHPWYTPTGEHLKIDQETVDWCFEIVDFMLDHFCVRPKQLADRKAKLAGLKATKKAGDAT